MIKAIKMYLKNKIYLAFLTEELAQNIARLQYQADNWYYRKDNKNMSEYFLHQVTPLKDIAIKNGIDCNVFKKAYKIYDFRNSGKAGYILVGGKIVKEKKEGGS